MTAYVDVDAYDAGAHFPEYLRKAQSGMSFRITNRGEHVADLIPPGTAKKRDGAKAAERMRQFIQTQPAINNITALIEEGRD
jgi:prevent-host-death family protein